MERQPPHRHRFGAPASRPASRGSAKPAPIALNPHAAEGRVHPEAPRHCTLERRALHRRRGRAANDAAHCAAFTRVECHRGRFRATARCRPGGRRSERETSTHRPQPARGRRPRPPEPPPHRTLQRWAVHRRRHHALTDAAHCAVFTRVECHRGRFRATARCRSRGPHREDCPALQTRNPRPSPSSSPGQGCGARRGVHEGGAPSGQVSRYRAMPAWRPALRRETRTHRPQPARRPRAASAPSSSAQMAPYGQAATRRWPTAWSAGGRASHPAEARGDGTEIEIRKVVISTKSRFLKQELRSAGLQAGIAR